MKEGSGRTTYIASRDLRDSQRDVVLSQGSLIKNLYDEIGLRDDRIAELEVENEDLKERCGQLAVENKQPDIRSLSQERQIVLSGADERVSSWVIAELKGCDRWTAQNRKEAWNRWSVLLSFPYLSKEANEVIRSLRLVADEGGKIIVNTQNADVRETHHNGTVNEK